MTDGATDQERDRSTDVGLDRCGRRFPFMWSAVYLVASILVSWAWAVSGPVGSSPDEEHHIPYAYGTITGAVLPWNLAIIRTSTNHPWAQVEMPADLMHFPDHSEYALDNTQPPTEVFEDETLAGQGRISADGTAIAETHMSGYPLLYYAPVGAILHAGDAAGLSGTHTLVTARTFSGVVSFALVGLAGLVAARRLGVHAVALALVVAFTPMAAFLSSSINPNGFEVAAAMLASAAVLATRSDIARHGRVGGALQVLLVLSIFALAWCRPASVTWAGLLCLLFLVPVRTDQGQVFPLRTIHVATVVSTVGVIAFSTAWAVWALGLRESAGLQSGEWDAMPAALRLTLIGVKFGAMIRDSVGLFGWIDTPLPDIVVIAWFVLGAATLATWLAGRGRAATPFGLALAFLGGSALVPAVQTWVSGVGWQGRYWLPALSAFVVLCAGSLQGRTLAGRRPWPTWAAVMVLLGAGMSAIVWNMWRYVHGYDAVFNRFPDIPNATSAVAWRPTGGTTLIIVAAVVGAALFMILTSRLLLRRVTVPEVPDERARDVLDWRA